MDDPKNNESFLRKVVRFVANPGTDWNNLSSRPFEQQAQEIEKSELKAMIERKRRNDFVRKREFDILRKVRREGLTPEQLAALGGSSRLDDSEARPESRSHRPDGVKAKIDEIEQQMVDEGGFSSTRRGAGAFAPSSRAPMTPADEPFARPTGSPPALSPMSKAPDGRRRPSDGADSLPSLSSLPPARDSRSTLPKAPAVMAAKLPPLSVLPDSAGLAAPAPTPAPVPAPSASPLKASSSADVEVNEVVHDPELDEAVIAFANADFEQCEDVLTRLIQPNAARHDHAETWLVLFDLFRAIGEQQRFETLAVEYAHQFGQSAPQWYSLPRLVADAVADERPVRTHKPASGDVGWVAPESLDIEALARLRSQTLQMPLPWVFDWGALRRVDAEAATQLSILCRLWSGQALQMRWLSAERLFSALQEAAPTGVRDADPAFWLARLDALRLANRPDQFDEAAIDYCVTYEVSPPSWESSRCKVHLSESDQSTRPPPLSVVGDVSTSFHESRHGDEGVVQQATVELSGQLIGDIGDTLAHLNDQVGDVPRVVVACPRLIRVDFLAAGDLLNWVLTKQTENRTVLFVDAHRLLALFFGAMGINEHAGVHVRNL